jgi:ATP-dependent DNA helicase UvrD/PcrA
MSDPGLADEIGGRFDHVLVDEYQDTNRLQSSILLALKPGGHGLTVVGDDAQSIYSFRAATVRNILDFPTRFSPPASIITLDRNYRSTQTIPGRSQRRHRPCERPLHKEPLDRQDIRCEAATDHRT